MVVLGALAGVRAGAFTRPVPALSLCALALVWGLAFVVIAVRHDPVPGWALVADTAVVSVGAGLLPWFTHPEVFDTLVNPDLEPLSVSVAIAVGLLSGSGRAVAASCACMAAAYVAALGPFGYDLDLVAGAVSVGAWQAGAGFCSWVMLRRLQDAARLVDAATAQAIVARETLAAERAQAEERLRQGRDRTRRYRALHDGPLRILTAVAGPGPAGHPDPRIRRQCAISANLLRGTTSDTDDVLLTDLSLALVEAGDELAAHGLRVHYNLARLPEDLPEPVVDAFRAACGEALHNVQRHAGVTRAWLTATSDGDPNRPTVRVAVVDQGGGFEPEAARAAEAGQAGQAGQAGHGLGRSILQRMAEVGGLATITSHPHEGTRIDLTWPAPPGAASRTG
jgi:signal transduction histidine kinase